VFLYRWVSTGQGSVGTNRDSVRESEADSYKDPLRCQQLALEGQEFNKTKHGFSSNRLSLQ